MIASTPPAVGTGLIPLFSRPLSCPFSTSKIPRQHQRQCKHRLVRVSAGGLAAGSSVEANTLSGRFEHFILDTQYAIIQVKDPAPGACT